MQAHIVVRKCLLLSQRNNKCKNCIKMKNVNVQISFLIRDIWAGGKGHMSSPPPPFFVKIKKSWNFSIEACIQIKKNYNIISFFFFLLFSFENWPLSGPPSKLVPHFVVHSYSSAISHWLLIRTSDFCPNFSIESI